MSRDRKSEETTARLPWEVEDESTRAMTDPDAPRAGASSYLRGDSVGRYLVLGNLGEGAMGKVYSAYDPELDRKVAIKLLRPRGERTSAAANQQARSRLEREARALARLSHPNVVQVYDAGAHWREVVDRDSGQAQLICDVFLAMEHIEGVSLATWQQRGRRRPWREILRVYLDACRGLAAAHRAGMIHRDIKPDNILIASDGRARVADFGLAAALDREGSAEAVPVPSDESSPNRGAGAPRRRRASSKLEARLDDHLTHPGAIMGTPMYMAPEQHEGNAVGPAADQYSICVSLYQALYRVRPFARHRGGSRKEEMRELLRAKREHAIVKPSPDSDAPLWLAAVLRRGMAPLPEDRYGSMDPLIAALEDDPEARRAAAIRRAGLGLAAVIVAALAIVGWLRSDPAAAPCAGVEKLMAGVWDDEVRQRARAAFAASGVPYAADTVARVIERLDPYAAQWLNMRSAQCRAPEDPLAAATALCMARRRSQLSALGELFGGQAGTLDSKLVSRAVQAAASVPPLSDCADEAYLTARVLPPDDRAMRERVEELQPRVARLQALEQAAQYSDGLKESETLLADLGSDAHPPLLAEALHWTAKLYTGAGNLDQAEAMVRRSITAAARGKDHVLVAKGWALVLHLIGTERQRLDEAEHLMAWIEVPAIQADDDGALADVLNSVGNTLARMGKLAQARANHERSLTIRERALGQDHPAVAVALNNLANVQRDMGEYDRAYATYEKARVSWQRALGDSHPNIASVLINQGNTLSNQGKYKEARAAYERALEISERAAGSEHSSVASILTNMGNVLLAMGEYQKAETDQKRAIAIWEKSLGKDHPWIAVALNNLGDLHTSTGRYREARASYERALAVRENALGDAHPAVAVSLSRLGRTLGREGAYRRATAMLERALTMWEKALGQDHPYLARALVGLGQVHLAQGHLDTAEGHLERALALRQDALGKDHPELVETLVLQGQLALERDRAGGAVELMERARAIGNNRDWAPHVGFALAKALWQRNGSGDRRRAIALADEAKDIYAARPNQPLRASVEDWLASHRQP